VDYGPRSMIYSPSPDLKFTLKNGSFDAILLYDVSAPLWCNGKEQNLQRMLQSL